ncbi:hypothetical protein BDN70DRAFT_771342, partial [Pholiota conissans]
LWRQFLVDVTAKVPNRRSSFESSYCVLSKVQRSRVNEDIYRNLNLREYFNDCLYRTATKADWESSFDKCWPQKGKYLPLNAQNYTQMKYYRSWGTLIGRSEATLVEEMRQSLYKRFLKLKWFPNAQNDRLWPTK